MGRLSDKFAVVAGGSSGIGLATAHRFISSDDASYFTGADLVADGGLIQV